MNVFVAIVFVCAASIDVQACDEATATDVFSTRVDNELGCAIGWQEIVARSSLKDGVGSDTYLKTACRRLRRGDRERPNP